MGNIIKNMLTGKDNETHDVVRVLGFLFGIALIIYEGYIVVVTQTFDAVNFGIAAAGMLAAVGAGVALKQKAEPDIKE